MTCRRMRTWIALAAGGDLSPRRARRLEAHLTECAACREENQQIRRSLDAARSLAQKERTPDWSGEEWRKVMARAVGQEIGRRKPRFSEVPGWAWAAGTALLIIFVLGGFRLLRQAPGPSLVAERGPRADLVLPEQAPSTPAPAVVEPLPLSKPRAAASRSGLLPAQKPVPSGPTEPISPAFPAPQTQAQSVMAMTFVSQETGLKIYWVFNDNFDYKENER